ncbi:MAG: hypothetical protein ABS21_02225 [SAR86 cluster bacterium BACL1 MAG-121105-bin34]|jgi:rhodanese-related sulfurtransferase|uniref:Rhodanese domain-containing protein n=2 Tax=SAR86 cluster TaxID=62672 RepID=A0A0R2U5T7_9GAMM|nr:MAG: hypothetical protein ABR59_00975 [SAR86 cluster bacterium BACL1 MAG-120507-bin14]KRO40952.1 MAG: hypothetical protein ABR63_05870 [SAR86 cluster bacterium BACL1 MAG-120920-bin57]KRO94929.1 MAG: hypothetical protein ABS10_05110 [SAR86 cluster bacterium BACL1 MAG-120820-bin45]KRO97894.1 MAG: hypothetical protein ABS15_00275 [SAR86 cluster bacterium BACL1 MAG-120823-bin87]KRO97922.1 MAG: hypothetical protein ABS14_05820 [SAR86 cluster bacterium BACL1 MAG-120813-bin36]KRP00717.1 MAG: hypot|tara:strand:- start:234 stop:593 length:360 start_codon:yes stop_codon:yes gene_type:complete
MNYTEQELAKAEQLVPRTTFNDFNNNLNKKVMIDVRQSEELEASGSIQDALNIPKGVIEFQLSNHEEIDQETCVYLFCAAGVRSALAGLNLTKIGYTKVFNLGGFQDILDQGAIINKNL